MTIRTVTPQRAEHLVLRNLGLDSDAVDLTSSEALCQSLRRAASLLCPATPRTLVDSVLDAVRPLHPALKRSEVNDLLDVLIGHGDLLEADAGEGSGRILYLGPPSFVPRGPGEFLLLGIRPSGGALVDEGSIGASIEYESHTRTVHLDDAEILVGAGLRLFRREQWAQAPRPVSAVEAVQAVADALEGRRSADNIDGLEVIANTGTQTFYKGRWRTPTMADNGVLVGRRPQRFGAAMWCAVLVDSGVVMALLDFPTPGSVAPGWDEARRLQAALDARRGHPQSVRVRRGETLHAYLVADFFAPLPTWAERYLDLLGTPVDKSRGALFSYRFREATWPRAERFLADHLWMQEQHQ